MALGWCLVSVEAFDELLSINVPWTQEFSAFGLKPPASSLLHVTVNLYGCPSLWRNFIINLDVLSLVLYRRRSLETTVKMRLKTRSRRLKSNP